MAEAEATKAEAALTKAMQANTDAQAALTAANAAETSEAAEAEQAKAEAANVIATEAHTGDTGAGMAYMAAKAAAEKAFEAAGVYVAAAPILGVANADNLEGEARTSRMAAVRTAINLEATTGDGDTTPNTADGATTVNFTWRYHGDAGTDTTFGTAGRREAGRRSVGISTGSAVTDDITVGANTVEFMRDNPQTAGDDESYLRPRYRPWRLRRVSCLCGRHD